MLFLKSKTYKIYLQKKCKYKIERLTRNPHIKKFKYKIDRLTRNPHMKSTISTVYMFL